MKCDEIKCATHPVRWLYVAVFIIAVVLLAPACSSTPPDESPEQQARRLDTIKTKSTNATLTILPARAGGNPFDRLTEAIGTLLEQQGLQHIELGTNVFDPGGQSDLGKISVSLAEFLQKNPVSTEYALYADFSGSGGVREIRAILVDNTGSPIWKERITPENKVWKEMGGGGDLLLSTVVLVQCLAPQFGLNEETAKAAKPGKMGAIMAERSGQPPDSEIAPIAGRQAEMKRRMPKGTMVVYSGRVRTADQAPEAGNATELAARINETGLCKASPAPQPLVLTSPQTDPNEMKVLWDLAREFREYVRKNPVDADYVLYTDYRFNPQVWQAGFVHVVVCDRQGEWVIADLRNSDHPDYQNVQPRSQGDCDKILVVMLQRVLGTATGK